MKTGELGNDIPMPPKQIGPQDELAQAIMLLQGANARLETTNKLLESILLSTKTNKRSAL
jgi:hypothetical protein